MAETKEHEKHPIAGRVEPLVRLAPNLAETPSGASMLVTSLPETSKNVIREVSSLLAPFKESSCTKLGIAFKKQMSNQL